MSDTKRLGAMSLDAVRGPSSIKKHNDDSPRASLAAPSQASRATVGDRVDIGAAKELKQLTALVTSENDAALQTIKEQLDDGSYSVDHDKLAERMNDELQKG
ncbi:MAG: anti-sigma28 factor (negative regulator of flagellin synthesis) [Bradymonadia bacterium]|jgi:anti-sigma28 factor (negative regulator of flagellin synthesis)